MQTMSQGGPGASLPRFGRRLLFAGLVLDAAELVCCGLPLVLWMRDSAWDQAWLRVALPLTLALWAAAALRTAYLVRPVLDIVAALRAGGKPKLPEAEKSRPNLQVIMAIQRWYWRL